MGNARRGSAPARPHLVPHQCEPDADDEPDERGDDERAAAPDGADLPALGVVIIWADSIESTAASAI